jgi:cytochrome c peroxidase
MHDGSLATLGDVLRHYNQGVVERETLSPDLRRNLDLGADEQAALVAFLGTLASEADPRPPATIVAEKSRRAAPADRVTTVTQNDKEFFPGRLRIRRGERLWILNNDTRTHNVRVHDPKFEFDSGAQEPGETVQFAFPKVGSYLVFCGIHPKMEIAVEVTR